MENTGPLVQVKLYLQTTMTKLKILNGERRETAIKKCNTLHPKLQDTYRIQNWIHQEAQGSAKKLLQHCIASINTKGEDRRGWSYSAALKKPLLPPPLIKNKKKRYVYEYEVLELDLGNKYQAKKIT